MQSRQNVIQATEKQTIPVFQPNTFAYDVFSGLLKHPKELSSKYFYDTTGSQIFEQIMDLPEYYPTRCEAEIFEEHKNTVLELCRKDYFHIVDLGAGDASKTGIFIDHFYKQHIGFEYIPVDISSYAVDDLIRKLKQKYPRLATRSVATDYLSALHWIHEHVQGKKLVLFLGSNIGNFSIEECRLFLANIWQLLDADDRLLIGFDLRKNAEIIRNAYNDKSGVTAQFNKNLLRRINTELGGNFNLDSFEFYASYDPVSGFVKSYVISNKAQYVYIEAFGRGFDFKAWETIHMENSRKFTLEEIEELADFCGYEVEMNLFDSKQYFTDSIWKVVGKADR
ncbi:L-histidine N(alpha)-methyltransferase [Rhodocytophaga aerolata]|uniref:L-histidine N(Alpha)-methyltransferase n=1 Tax=Rhodocytophaga aerolata TaxID=455078 RepID=A0ABT8RE09_9BACT|nr:L-histidine N(alpha)-methyltransferase [Rhodocytophaga aerolata]MDO1450337.1 L-histidine N(alpha)-methyltransferase [Rhodocytophaga aerolata]